MREEGDLTLTREVMKDLLNYLNNNKEKLSKEGKKILEQLIQNFGSCNTQGGMHSTLIDILKDIHGKIKLAEGFDDRGQIDILKLAAHVKMAFEQDMVPGCVRRRGVGGKNKTPNVNSRIPSKATKSAKVKKIGKATKPVNKSTKRINQSKSTKNDKVK